MKIGETETLDTGVLVIGCGGAGLRAAIEARAAGADVLVVSKSVSSNTAVAGGAMAAATGWRDPKDSPEAHVQDTLAGGRFINNRALVEVMALGAGDEVRNLESCGVRFMKQNDRIWMTLTTGHTYARTMVCEQRLGIGFTRPLRQYAESAGVRFIDNLCLAGLLHKDGMVFGAAGIDKEGRTMILRAGAVVLAAGGLGQIYLRTCNAAGMTGDGYVWAYEAGVPLQDMEMVQYFPTALGAYGGRQVIYDAFVARTGAPVRNSLGEDLLEKHGIKDPINMTRDRLARAIMLEILEGRGIDGHVIIDLSMVPDDRMERMRPLLPAAVSLKDKKLAVAPTAHYCMGGVIINTNCATSVSGLYAAGEVCGGIHGANRLGSNALTEIFVFGAIAGKRAADYASKIKDLPEAGTGLPAALESVKKLASSKGGERTAGLRTSLKETMWYRVGIIRSQAGLEDALAKVNSIEAELPGLSAGDYQEMVKAIELQNMVAVSRMVIKSALERKESRGSHYRSDYPDENDRDWLNNMVVSKGKAGMTVSMKLS